MPVCFIFGVLLRLSGHRASVRSITIARAPIEATTINGTISTPTFINSPLIAEMLKHSTVTAIAFYMVNG